MPCLHASTLDGIMCKRVGRPALQAKSLAPASVRGLLDSDCLQPPAAKRGRKKKVNEQPAGAAEDPKGDNAPEDVPVDGPGEDDEAASEEEGCGSENEQNAPQGRSSKQAPKVRATAKAAAKGKPRASPKGKAKAKAKCKASAKAKAKARARPSKEEQEECTGERRGKRAVEDENVPPYKLANRRKSKAYRQAIAEALRAGDDRDTAMAKGRAVPW